MIRLRSAALVLVAIAASTAGAAAHKIPWQAGMSRTVGFGHCAKGPCMKRSTFSRSVPHRHVGGGVCEGMGAGGYRFGSKFPC